MKTIVVLFALALYAEALAQSNPPIVPQIKTELTPRLIALTSEIQKRWDGKPSGTIFSNDLFLANGNRGYDLINPATQNALLAAIDKSLEAFSLVGLKGVGLAIQYPLFVTGFPNSDKYLDFFKKVFQRIRARGFQSLVECQAAFVDTTFSEKRFVDDLQVWYKTGPSGSALTSDRYVQEKSQMMQTIINELSPDYLTLVMEPMTEQANLMNYVPMDVASAVSNLTYYLNTLTPGAVKIGAGAGSWDKVEYFQEMAKLTKVQFLNYHVYPPHFDFVDNKVFKIDSLAKLYHKDLLIGEAWCYKATSTEILNATEPIASSREIYSRDFFDYYQPLDSLFVRMIVRLSTQSKIKFTSFFWPTLMFGNLTYNQSVHDPMSYKDRLSAGQQAGYQNMLLLKLSPIGELMRDEIKKATTSVRDIAQVPLDMRLHQNYPNPFNPSTVISYQIPTAVVVSLKVLDVLGREVATLVDEYKMPGKHNSQFSISNSQLSSSVYFYQLKAGNYVQTKKMIVVK